MVRAAHAQLQLLQGGLSLSAIGSVIEERIFNLVKSGKCLSNRNGLRRSVQIQGRWISVVDFTRVLGSRKFPDRMSNISTHGVSFTLSLYGSIIYRVFLMVRVFLTAIFVGCGNRTGRWPTYLIDFRVVLSKPPQVLATVQV